MARRQIKTFDSERLAEVISEVEKNGPLDSLGIFYETVATAYNKERGKLSPVNKSFVSNKIRSLKLNHKTKASKNKGARTSTRSAEDDILVPLTDWEKKEVTVGKYAGTVTNTRMSIRFDSRQWMIVKETDSASVAQKYYTSFRRLIPCTEEYFPELDIREQISNIVNALAERLEQINPLEFNPDDDLAIIGKDIDKAFNANFYWNEDLAGQLRAGTPAETVAA